MRLVTWVRQRVRRVDLPTPSITRRLRCLHRSPLVAAKLQSVAHRSLLATGSLLAASLLPPESTGASKLRPCKLVLWLQTLQPVEVEGQVVVAGPGRSGLVVTKSADAVVVSWKK
jgi:hypothetical protein